MSQPTVLYLGRDLFLSGPIRQAAMASGWSFQQSEPTAPIPSEAGDPLVAVFDLGALKDAVSPLAQALKTRVGKTVMIGISFHTDTESHERGEKAGLDRIIHRSRLGHELKAVLDEAFSVS
ncbi:MAG: hypothetical protein ACYC9S_02345 [Leptospirales bacterium]